MKVNVLEAKNRLSALLEAARSGEEVVIAKRGIPVARLVPIEQPAVRPGSGAALLRWLADHPLPPGSQRSHEEIEAAIADQRASWD